MDSVSLNITCGGCGFEAASEFAFCPKCGQRLAAAAAEATPSAAAQALLRKLSEPGERETLTDRRPVTVLFADLSGFTALSERLDPEDVRALQTDLFKQMSETIQRFDGFVEKFVGDAVMAVFGAPVAHDEDPERAIRAAMAMHARMVALNADWMPRLRTTLNLHIGINTGPVVAGTIGAGRDSAYAVTGDTVNLAARLQNAAAPGQIVISHATYVLTQHAFSFEFLGDLSLKGKAEPVSAYRAVAPLAAPQSPRGLQAHGLAAPLIGRDVELRALLSAFTQMLSGRTQLVSIVAEAGAGKSRLLSEFLATLNARGQLDGLVVRNAACSPVAESTYGVPAALLREGYGIAEDDCADVARSKITSALSGMGAKTVEIEHVSDFLGYVLGFGARDPSIRHLEPEQLKRQIFHAVEAVIVRRLQHSPMLLIVEDLHWTDAASVELLEFLIERLVDQRFMLLTTRRPASEGLQFAVEGAAHLLLRLEPLSADHSESLLATLFGTSAGCLPAELRARIVQHAGGNPLFLEEMVRGLIADGVLTRENDDWVYQASSAAVQVPLTIHGLLLARIDRLPARVRQALQEAAVIGPWFDEPLLREVAGDPTTLGNALATLVDAGLLQIAQDGERGPVADAGECQYRFRHGLFHEVAYQNLLARRRTELHTRIGRALERLCSGAPQRLDQLEALGHHFRLSDDKPRGARYLISAGDWARSVYANADAIRHYQRALETLDASDTAQIERLPVRERLSDVLAPLGKGSEALRHLTVALDGYASAADAPSQARVLRKMANLHWQAGDRLQARQCLQGGLGLVDKSTEDVEHARLYQEMGQLEFRSGDNQGALQWAQRALTLIESFGRDVDNGGQLESSAVLSLALNTQGVALARLDRLEDAVEKLERSVQVARVAGLLYAECRALANLGVLYSTRAPKQAIEACERGLDTAKRIGDLGLQSHLYTNLAVAYCTLTNRCDENGIGAANRAIEIDPTRRSARSSDRFAHRVGADLSVPWRDPARARVLRGGGGPGRAERRAAAAVSLLRWSGDLMSGSGRVRAGRRIYAQVARDLRTGGAGRRYPPGAALLDLSRSHYPARLRSALIAGEFESKTRSACAAVVSYTGGHETGAPSACPIQEMHHERHD